MKKIGAMLMALAAYSATVHAAQGDSTFCSIFEIHIKNNSSADCVLKKSYMPLGKLSYEGTLPEVIFRDKEASFYMQWYKSHYFITALMLSYQCGDDKEIVLYSTTPSVEDSSILEKKNMEAKFSTRECSEYSKQFWKISWVLQDTEVAQS